MTDASNAVFKSTAELRQTINWASIAKMLPVVWQLGLAALVVHLYAIEGPAFSRVFALAIGGFAVSALLPLRYRLPFFVLVSGGGIFAVFTFTDGLWLIACGVVLIGICRLPISMPLRVLSLLVVGGILAAGRGGTISAPWSAAVWPILGSMFMFRLALYLLALKANTVDRSWWAAFAYFFMLPNLVFPLFPVVDYVTFRRAYYDRDEVEIYLQGLHWIARGLLHLILYRLVYYGVLNDPIDIASLGDLVQFMVGTFLLYLRVSGQFHLIVGLLHLFGFRLPETHKLYYLAHSFTELWRRINIYWTDFMMKTVFYPTYFKAKRLGPTRALVVATAAVFFTTWVLHSYQWFWLRGGFPVTLQDTLFWGALGSLVILGALRELRPQHRRERQSAGWSWRSGWKAAATFCAFCFLWSLWSVDEVGRWVWILGAAATVDLKGVWLLALVVSTVMLLGGLHSNTANRPKQRWLCFLLNPSTRTVGVLVLLVVVAQPAVHAMAPPPLALGLRSLQMTGLNTRDAALHHRGYYEQLEVRPQLNARVLDVLEGRDKGWETLADIGVLRNRDDMILRDLLPSRSTVLNGNTFSTNRWGMRDREYDLEKPPGTLRIALLGPSHVMGNGVSDGETFDALLEERLNEASLVEPYTNVEVLNFGVDAHSVTQQVALLEDRVFEFSPDVVILTHHQRMRSVTESYILKIVGTRVWIRHDRLRDLIEKAGLDDGSHGTVPVPFPTARILATRLGLQPRMPGVEAEARARRIGGEVLAWSFERFAEVAASNGAVPLVLALNAVIDDAAPDVPDRQAITDAGLPLIDLFDVFPVAERHLLRVASWDDHPNAAGHRRVADHLYPAVVDFLQSRVTADRRSATRWTSGT